MTMLASFLTDELRAAVMVRVFELKGIAIEVERTLAECGWGRVPWVYFTFCDTEKKSATYISFREFTEGFLSYMFTATVLAVFLKSQEKLDRAMAAIANPERLENIFDEDIVGMVGAKLGYIKKSKNRSKKKSNTKNKTTPVVARVLC